MEPLAWQQGVVLDDDLVGSLESAHEDVLDQSLEIMAATHPSVPVQAHLLREDPAIALLRLADSAALLVVGTRQRRGLKRMWLGSVSHAVVLDIVSPTAIIHSSGGNS
jgi:nucleotide-binding universal stress UspA family protein